MMTVSCDENCIWQIDCVCSLTRVYISGEEPHASKDDACPGFIPRCAS